MKQFLISFFIVVLTSCYFFPFEFTFLPGVNTKMIIAVIGLALFGLRTIKNRELIITKEYVLLGVFSALISLTAFATAIINNTNDFTYADYIVSMIVWLFGAYAVVDIIRMTYGRASVGLICNYLIAVCVLQCALALTIDNSTAFKSIVDRYISGMGFINQDRLSDSGRLYGIGCSLDVAGTRFASVLPMIAQMILSEDNKKEYVLPRFIYIFSFFFIIVIGDMISRTTIIGVVLAIIVFLSSNNTKEKAASTRWIIIMGIVFFIGASFLYNTNPAFHSNLRFAFEGFFSLAEKGYWETNSNNILKEMVVFPESLKTWIIGDGYLLNPFMTDPNYIGQDFHGFYMQTDIGYLRFIFYFGVIGLILFSAYMCIAIFQLISRFPAYRNLFLILLASNFIIWFKVSTDIFLIYALFLCLFSEEDDSIIKDETDLSDQLPL